MDSSKAHRTLERVIRLLAEKRYSDLCRVAPKRLTSEQIQTAASEYPFQIVYPSVPLELLIDVIEITNSNPTSWSVDVDLWTKEEGRSDLTLQLTLSESDDEFYSTEIDNLYVL